MVFPIGDDNTGRLRTPYVTYLLIALNVLVFVFLQGMGTNEKFTYTFSTVPQEIRTGEDVAGPVRIEVGDESATIPLQQTPGSVYLTLLISMFMHGSLMHLLGNMLFLWIFGDNIEDDLGHPRYTFSISRPASSRRLRTWCRLHVRRQPVHPEPRRVGRDLGSDGRVSGDAPAPPGARDHPADADQRAGLRRRRPLVRPPVDQRLRRARAGPQSGGGVAFMAHIGGFIAGAVLVRIFAIGSAPPARRGLA